MKMKIILVLSFFSLLIFISFIQNNSSEINYTILGDKELFSNNLKSVNFADLVSRNLEEIEELGFYSKDFIKENIRTIDVINDINQNLTIDNISIQNILKRTDILIINIGNNEINYKLSKINYEENDNEIYRYLDEVIIDIQDLFKTIKKINKKRIIFLGYYNDTNNVNNDKYYIYINKKIKEISNNENIEFIDLYNILNKNNDYITKSNPVYITNEGNIAIYNNIIRKINKLDLHKNN